MNMLARDPLLQALKKELTPEKKTIKGIVKATPHNYGFLVIESYTAFIPPALMKKVLAGDRLIATIAVNKGKYVVTKWNSLIESKVTIMHGRVQQSTSGNGGENYCHFISDDINDVKHYRICADKEKVLLDGDWVKVKVNTHAIDKGFFYVDVLDVVGFEEEETLPWKYVKSKHGVTKDRADLVDKESIKNHYEDRVDWDYVTIDGEFSSDLDDAIYVERGERSYMLHIAIADPSFLFTCNESALLSEAFSLYMPKNNTPLLQDAKISSKYSLNERISRPALCADIEVCATSGEIINVRFLEAFIRSRKKLSYAEVASFIEGKSLGRNKINHRSFSESLLNLKLLSDLRFKTRKLRSINYNNSKDVEFVFNGMTPVAVKKFTSLVSHDMIKESAILANEAFSIEALKRDSSGIFNVHGGLRIEHKKEVQSILKKLSITVEQDIATDLGFIELNNALILRESQLSLSNQEELRNIFQVKKFFHKTIFSNKPQPHFFLGLKAYGTWTSPLRKVGDMINHLVIKSWIHENDDIRVKEAWIDEISKINNRNKNIRKDINHFLKIKLLQNSSTLINHGIVTFINKKLIKLRVEAVELDVILPIFDLGKGYKGNVSSQEVYLDNRVSLQLGDVVSVHLEKIDLLHQDVFVSKLS
jgi:exoribonuclease-2